MAFLRGLQVPRDGSVEVSRPAGPAALVDRAEEGLRLHIPELGRALIVPKRRGLILRPMRTVGSEDPLAELAPSGIGASALHHSFATLDHALAVRRCPHSDHEAHRDKHLSSHRPPLRHGAYRRSGPSAAPVPRRPWW